MAAKTLPELEIEVASMKAELYLLISVLRRDVDIIMKINQPQVTILDKIKPNTDAGENIS